MRGLATRLTQGQSLTRVLGIAVLIGLGAIFPACLGIVLTRGVMVTGARTVDDVLLDFDRNGYDLKAVAAGTEAVPRVFLTSLPPSWRQLSKAADRKSAFTMVMLPLVLRANEILLTERARLEAISARIAAKKTLSDEDRAWVLNLGEQHKSKAAKVTGRLLKTLMTRIDIVPPSLALAQAAIESGWGTSRFATKGNALFGQWSEDTVLSLIPANRDAERTYAVKSFVTLLDSVMAYMRNLNSHRAYREFRAARAKSRAAGQEARGLALSALIGSYSQDGPKYIQVLAAIIVKNGLEAFDGAELKP